MWWFALSGCLSDEALVAELEDALRTTNDALAAGVVATEIRVHARETPDVEARHVTACGCPCRTRTGAPPAFVLSLDYHPEGCLPVSGLLGTGMSGVLVLEVEGEDVRATLDGGALATRPLSGVLKGPVDDRTITSRGTYTVDGKAFDLDLDATFDADGLSLDGEVAVDGVPVDLAGVFVPTLGLGARCPTPSEGLATIGEGPPIPLDFAEPGDGTVTLTRRSRASAPTDLCQLRSDLL